MLKLEYTKQEIEELKTKIYFTEEEIKILDMLLLEKSIVEISTKLNISTATVSRKKKSIIEKIKRIS